ncbi:hypothetical protein R6Z07F_004368 [Ovis aries]
MAAWSPAAAVPLLRGTRRLPLLHWAQRMFASQTEGELKVTQILREKFPRATAIKVTDISGGCGAMYEIKIESEEFKEKRTVQQHQMVNQALKEEIKGQLCSGGRQLPYCEDTQAACGEVQGAAAHASVGQLASRVQGRDPQAPNCSVDGGGALPAPSAAQPPPDLGGGHAAPRGVRPGAPGANGPDLH